MTDSPLRSRLLIITTAILFSTGGAAIKAVSVGGWQIACGRSIVAALFLLAAIPEARRGWRWGMLPVAACYAATVILFVLSNRLTTAANAIFLQSAAPLYLLLLGPLVLDEPIRRRDVGFVAVVACGIACFFAGSPRVVATAPDPVRGNVLAIGAGVAYALMLAGLRWLSRKGAGDGAIATVALGNLVAFAVALPMALPVPDLQAKDVTVLVFLGVLQIGMAYWCLTRGIRHVPAVQASALLMVEPALNPVWTWMVHGETPGTWELAGGVLIVMATLWNTWRPAQAA